VSNYDNHPSTRANTTEASGTIHPGHPGDLVFIDLTKKLRASVARGWRMEDDLESAAMRFDNMPDADRWHVVTAASRTDGSYEEEEARIAARADAETNEAFDAIARGLGAGLLDELHEALTKYVVFPSAEATDAVVLWITATHGLAAFEHATRLAIHSPVKRCGKTRLLEVIEATAHHPIPTTNISVPALFRIIDAADPPPTLILDEVDRLLGSAKKDDDNRDLVAILNNGFRAGHPTYRCVGPTQVPTPFSNYAMAAIAGIGHITDTIEDRAVNITLRRRLPGETISKYRLRTDVPALHDLRGRLGEWVGSVMAKLETPVVGIPDELEDRAEDAWEPLVAVADAAGGHWPARGRLAAVVLTREAADTDDDSLDTRILADIRGIRDRDLSVTFISSTELIMELRKLDDAPWADLDLTGRKLAYRVGKFGVKPKRNKAQTARGYYLHDLEDAFRRYLPSNPSIRLETPSDQEEQGRRQKPDRRVDPSIETIRLYENPSSEPVSRHIDGLDTYPGRTGHLDEHLPRPLTADELERMSGYDEEALE